MSPVEQLASAAMPSYELPENCSVRLVNISENATFEISVPDGRRWALRIHRDGYHSETAIASELAWLIDLRDKGVVTTPVPVRGRNGELIQLVPRSLMEGPARVVLFLWERGSEPGMDQNLIEPFKTLGESAARMHVHARNWMRPAWFERFVWDFETSLGDHVPHWGQWRKGMGMDQSRVLLFERTVSLIGKRLLAYGKGNDRFGLVHGDMRLANLLVDGTVVKVIDFDDCGFSWFMYDAAAPVSFHEHEPQVPDLIEAWKDGYRRVTSLAAADEAEIPTFVMLRRLLLIAWIGSHSDTDLARSMGAHYTHATDDLCEDYLNTF
jgi:Ser/Thr protein kinase RdoA (MazF antagonist)